MSESEGEIEVCVHLVGTLRDEIEVHLITTDITAIGIYKVIIHNYNSMHISLTHNIILCTTLWEM